MLYHLVQTVYWMALSTWFGGVLFIAVAAPIIFRVVRENRPVLPHVLSANLENQHGTLLAGSIVGGLLQMLARIELACATVLVITMTAQGFLIELDASSRIGLIARSAMLLAAMVLVIYSRFILWPRIAVFRQQYIDHADEPEIANPAKEQFDRYHHESVTLLSVVLFLLMGMILFSGNISAAHSGSAYNFGSPTNVSR